MNECRQVQLLHYRPDSWSKSTKAELQEEGHFILNSVWHLQKLLKNRFNRTFLNTGADQNSNRADIKGSMLNSGHGLTHLHAAGWAGAVCRRFPSEMLPVFHVVTDERLGVFLTEDIFLKIHPVTIFNWRYRRRYSEMTFTGTPVLPFSVWTHPLTLVLGSHKYLTLQFCPLFPLSF